MVTGMAATQPLSDGSSSAPWNHDHAQIKQLRRQFGGVRIGLPIVELL
jgi:hypothetical protein